MKYDEKSKQTRQQQQFKQLTVYRKSRNYVAPLLPLSYLGS